MKKRATLIRYPGAKAQLAGSIMAHFPDYLTLALYQSESAHYFEPFFGSGAIGLRVMQGMPRTAKATIADADVGIVSLWRAVQEEPEALRSMVFEFVPTVDAFYDLKERDGTFTGTLDTGFRKLALHRISVSGFGYMAGGPIGGREQSGEYNVDCRWKPVAIAENIHKTSRILNRLEVDIVHQDVQESLQQANASSAAGRRVFVYLDPPYYEKGGELYKYNMSPAEHEQLAESLRDASFEWALSYDNHEVIRDLYSEFPRHEIKVVYSNAVCREPTRRKNRELLITNCPANVF